MNSKKAIFTLVFAVLIWIITIFIQALIESPKYIATFTRSSCSATGYPFYSCGNSNFELILYALNLMFWFIVVNIAWFMIKKFK